MMSKFAILFLACVIIVVVSADVETQDLREWLAFKATHGKSYESHEIETLRRNIFSKNKQMIEKFNAEESEKLGFRLGLNHLSDYTASESNKLNGLKVSADDTRNSLEAQRFLDAILNDNSTEVPDELDWRKIPGRVTHVKDQELCGSCWTFSTTGVLEGQEAVRNKDGKLIELSEQNLLDCDKPVDSGCWGGAVRDALKFVKKQGGIEDELSYPYEGEDGKCRFNKEKVVFTVAGLATLPQGDEQKLKEVVAKFGPVSVGIDAEEVFKHYRGGVFNDKTCTSKREDLNHAVLVVGYGTDQKLGDFWLVKNSFGKHWGERGYIRMSRNKGNQCGIATDAIIPTF